MSATPGDNAPRVLFRTPMQLRWRDLDAFNHVNNANFLTYIEEARIRWFESLDRPWMTDAVAPLLAAVQMNYRMPIPYPSELSVELLAGRLGNTSATIEHRIVGADGTLFADGHVVMVWIDRATGRPVPLPDVIREMAA
ncbi:thioesterase family protein [Luteimonas pelagia]